MEDSLQDRIQMFDRISHALHRKHFWRYYSARQLRKKVPALRLWNEGELVRDLDIMSGEGMFPKVPGIILKKTRSDGTIVFRYNPKNYQRVTDAANILWSWKSDKERRAYLKEKLEFKKLDRETHFWKDPKFWIGFVAGTISACGALVSIYIAYLKCK